MREGASNPGSAGRPRQGTVGLGISASDVRSTCPALRDRRHRSPRRAAVWVRLPARARVTARHRYVVPFRLEPAFLLLWDRSSWCVSGPTLLLGPPVCRGLATTSGSGLLGLGVLWSVSHQLAGDLSVERPAKLYDPHPRRPPCSSKAYT